MNQDTVLVLMVPYVLLGFIQWRLEYYRGATAARNFLMLTPISTAMFLGIVWAVSGALPIGIVWLIAVVTGANFLFVGFCAQCGAMQRRRSWFGGPECQRCGSDSYVPLQTALRMWQEEKFVEPPPPPPDRGPLTPLGP